MEISKEMNDALNEQINKELYSAYIYYSMSAWFETQTLTGMAHWMRKQANEEIEHAQKIYKYVNERGGSVIMKAIDAPKTQWKSALEVFRDAYEHEKFVTASIDKLWDKAFSLKDKATMTFLKWFVDEQVEEEAQTSEIVEKLKMIGEAKSALLMFDTALGKRE